MLDSRAVLFGQKGHHLGRRWTAGDSVDFLPALGRFEQGAHGVESGDAIGSSDNSCQAPDLGREGWEVLENARILQREVFGSHDGGGRNRSVGRKGQGL